MAKRKHSIYERVITKVVKFPILYKQKHWSLAIRNEMQINRVFCHFYVAECIIHHDTNLLAISKNGEPNRTTEIRLYTCKFPVIIHIYTITTISQLEL